MAGQNVPKPQSQSKDTAHSHPRVATGQTGQDDIAPKREGRAQPWGPCGHCVGSFRGTARQHPGLYPPDATPAPHWSQQPQMSPAEVQCPLGAHSHPQLKITRDSPKPHNQAPCSGACTRCGPPTRSGPGGAWGSAPPDPPRMRLPCSQPPNHTRQPRFPTAAPASRAGGKGAVCSSKAAREPSPGPAGRAAWL